VGLEGLFGEEVGVVSLLGLDVLSGDALKVHRAEYFFDFSFLFGGANPFTGRGEIAKSQGYHGFSVNLVEIIGKGFDLADKLRQMELFNVADDPQKLK
jgi:hypothetical protein